LRLAIARAQRGDDKARVGFACRPFRLGDHPTLTAPAIAGRPLELLEAARRLAGGLALLLSRGDLGRDLGDQTLVLGQTKQEINPISLAPTHQGVAGKPRIGTQHNAHLGPAHAHPSDDARRLLHRSSGPVDVGAPQL
jgi:hypothetical protein